MKRFLDIFGASLAMLLLAVPALLIAGVVRATSRGPTLYWSDRVGKENRIFRMPKFRTMRTNTPPMATHLLKDADDYLTPLGKFLRRTSLDELPQLLCVLKGDMSFVGPRPALFNQDDLIRLRTDRGIHRLVPGITGWAQVNGRDDLPIPDKVEYDLQYLNDYSLRMDLKILALTLVRVLRRTGVTH